MIKAIYLHNGEFATENQIENLQAILDKGPKLIWLDIFLENNGLSAEEIAVLTGWFKFHELSLEDCLFPQYYPKIEEFDNYVFGAVHGIQLRPDYIQDFDDSIYELNFFVGKGFFVTVHSEELFFIETLFEKAKSKPHIEFKTLENLMYNIFNKVLSSFEFTMDKIDDKLDALEDLILENPTSVQMQEILDLKKVLLAMRKIAESQQTAYVYFTRSHTDFLSKESNAYFRDIFFQCARINQSISGRGKMISSLMEVYMSSVTLRLNEIMKFLTVVATIFLPVLIIGSYFGMNVKFPEYALFGEGGAWWFSVILIAMATLGVFVYIKKKKWF